MKKAVRFLTAIMLIITVFSVTVCASESTSYTYTQSVKKEWIRTQDAYMPGTVFLDDGTLSAPEDLFVFGDKMYIADNAVPDESVESGTTAGGKIVIYDLKNGSVSFLGESILKQPMGLYVNEEGIFVADKQAEAVYKLSHTGELLMTISRPDSYLFSAQSQYLPTAVAVSAQGTIFVCGEGAYEGLMQFDANGEFRGYFAANSTQMTFADRVKELIFNEEQMSQLENRIPNAIYNIDMSERDMIYSVTKLEANSIWTIATQTENAVKYHNMAGSDISSEKLKVGEHNFSDVAAYKDGLSFAVTSTGIIYEYDESGNVVFSFGGFATTDRSGHFVNATAIDVDAEGNIYILDREKAYFQMFFPTDFAVATHEALYNLNSGAYADSEAIWLELLSLNGMSYIAHRGYGKVLFHSMRYREAAEQFEIINDKASYSECIWEIRNNLFQKNLPYLIVLIAVLALLCFVRKILLKKGIIKKRRRAENKLYLSFKAQLLYVRGMIKNPFDELYYIKRGRHGTVISATVIFILVFILYFIDLLGRSFTFRLKDPSDTPIISLTALFIVPAFLWVIGNFMVSAISEGEGTLRAVYVSTAYSLTPYLILSPIVIASTYVLTLNESVIVHYLWVIAIAWSAALLCISVKEIHNYTVRETVKIILLTLFFMIMAVIVSVILYLIGQQVVIFIKDIINEVTYHA